MRLTTSAAELASRMMPSAVTFARSIFGGSRDSQRWHAWERATIAAVSLSPAVARDEGGACLKAIRGDPLRLGNVFRMNEFAHHLCKIIEARVREIEMSHIALADVSELTRGREAPDVDRDGVD